MCIRDRNAGFDLAALKTQGEVKLKPLTDEAKAWKTVWSAGQGVGEITDLPTTEQLITRMDEEYRTALSLTSQLAQHWPRH